MRTFEVNLLRPPECLSEAARISRLRAERYACRITELPQGCGAYVLVLPDMLLKTQRGNKASKEEDNQPHPRTSQLGVVGGRAGCVWRGLFVFFNDRNTIADRSRLRLGEQEASRCRLWMQEAVLPDEMGVAGRGDSPCTFTRILCIVGSILSSQQLEKHRIESASM
ncbi:uncharacterized protein CLUP02_05891 [Colletotrichum lupini]|uniref:Uncharacterized protein n=1 Tax=Colletotrichum lupini TaxID=145971 RepID=A0A9Q8WE55_9PEZI|nr:uncharacterized protein CLUP02_05891 [Colletotrichum lupini]UQC80408.1 hypothetical protein CLUP02_05891 [Colletotrichum lupini]